MATGNNTSDPNNGNRIEHMEMSLEGIQSIPRISIQAFCLKDYLASTLESASEDRRMSKAHTKIHMGGIPGAVDFYQQAPTPNLVIVEVEGDNDSILAQLGKLAEYCDVGTKVVVVGETNDIDLYRELKSCGVSEYLVAPVSVQKFIATINNLYADPSATVLGKTIAFFGAKGGVGASTIAHNVAWNLASTYQNEVTIADMDLPFGTAALDYNQDPLQGIWEAIATPERLDETLLDRIMASCSKHLNLLAAPVSLEQTYDANMSAFDRLTELMKATSPTTVLDIPHVWSDWSRDVLLHADQIVIVAEPDLANLRNAKNLFDTLRHLRPNDPKPHLVMNKINVPKRQEIKLDEFSSALDSEVLVAIPFDPHLFGQAANGGQMISEIDGRNVISDMMLSIAQVVSGRGDIAKNKESTIGSLFSRILSKSA